MASALNEIKKLFNSKLPYEILVVKFTGGASPTGKVVYQNSNSFSTSITGSNGSYVLSLGVGKAPMVRTIAFASLGVNTGGEYTTNCGVNSDDNVAINLLLSGTSNAAALPIIIEVRVYPA